MNNSTDHPAGTIYPLGRVPVPPPEIQELALDFHAGWYLGDRARLWEALHPGLARYLCERLPNPMDAGTCPAPAVEVVDLYGNLACLRLRGSFGKVLLQAIRYGQRWRVVNILGDAAWVA